LPIDIFRYIWVYLECEFGRKLVGILARGQVSIESDDGRLRLRFTVGDKRYAIALRLPDSKVNRKFAESKARQIELDILSNNFDVTLAKYKPLRSQAAPVSKEITTEVLLKQYIEFKARGCSKKTVAKLTKLSDNLTEFFGADKTTADLKDINGFVDWLKDSNCPETVRQKLTQLKAVWTWAIAQSLTTINPFENSSKQIKVSAPSRPKPFSNAEVFSILLEIKESYPHYFGYVAFLLSSGCRIGEAIALTWQNLNEDCTRIEINDTKRNKIRNFRLSPELASMLRSHRPEGFRPESFVFTSQEGCRIIGANFRNRVWVPLLTKLGIDYRKPYTSRSTFISHCLAKGMNPMVVAQITGHDPEVLFDHYAGFIDSAPIAPSLYQRLD